MRRVALVIIATLGFGLWGCATTEVAKPPPPPPREKLPSYYYVAVPELDLKEAADNSAKSKAVVKLNEKVEEIQRSGGWFQVKTADGRSGWSSSQYLEVKPLTLIYVSKKRICLRSAPDEKSKEVCQLQLNDQVKILDPKPQDWVEVSVVLTKEKGWVEAKNLSKDPLVAKQVSRKKRQVKATEKREKEAPKEDIVPVVPAAGNLAPSTPEAL